MTLTLHFHPLSSFCQKVLIALYENGTPFTPRIVDLMDSGQRAQFYALWPIGKFPVLQDDARGVTVPESSIIIEYLHLHYPGPVRLFPEDEACCLQMRLQDRLFDLYLNVPMQKVVTDRLRPPGQQDAFGVEDARAMLSRACDIVDQAIAGKAWIMGDDFTMADCAAAPALFYVNKVMPLGARHKHAAAYLDRLMQRPSYARVLAEAGPYLKLFPQQDERSPS
jgi:glutathione S-transferase